MTAPQVGQRVLYANAPYVVEAINGDLLVLQGVAYLDTRSSGRCRERCTVLASDVAVAGEKREGE